MLPCSWLLILLLYELLLQIAFSVLNLLKWNCYRKMKWILQWILQGPACRNPLSKKMTVWPGVNHSLDNQEFPDSTQLFFYQKVKYATEQEQCLISDTLDILWECIKIKFWMCRKCRQWPCKACFIAAVNHLSDMFYALFYDLNNVVLLLILKA